MARYLVVLAAVLAATPAESSVAGPPRPQTRSEAAGLNRAAMSQRPAPPAPQRVGPYRITPDTEVRLDGRPVDYRAVPPGAGVEYMEVTPDGAILTIYFLSPARRPAPCR